MLEEYSRFSCVGACHYSDTYPHLILRIFCWIYYNDGRLSEFNHKLIDYEISFVVEGYGAGDIFIIEEC